MNSFLCQFLEIIIIIIVVNDNKTSTLPPLLSISLSSLLSHTPTPTTDDGKEKTTTATTHIHTTIIDEKNQLFEVRLYSTQTKWLECIQVKKKKKKKKMFFSYFVEWWNQQKLIKDIEWILLLNRETVYFKYYRMYIHFFHSFVRAMLRWKSKKSKNIHKHTHTQMLYTTVVKSYAFLLQNIAFLY